MKDQFTPENSALVLIDHQVGTLHFVHSMSADDSLRNAVMLAKAAKAYDMPVVLTTSQEDHLQGPTAPALQDALPHAYVNRIKRTGIVNAWADLNFSGAVRAMGRKKLIMAAVTTDICLIFPAMSQRSERCERSLSWTRSKWVFEISFGGRLSRWRSGPLSVVACNEGIQEWLCSHAGGGGGDVAMD